MKWSIAIVAAAAVLLLSGCADSHKAAMSACISYVIDRYEKEHPDADPKKIAEIGVAGSDACEASLKKDPQKFDKLWATP